MGRAPGRGKGAGSPLQGGRGGGRGGGGGGGADGSPPPLRLLNALIGDDGGGAESARGDGARARAERAKAKEAEEAEAEARRAAAATEEEEEALRAQLDKLKRQLSAEARKEEELDQQIAEAEEALVPPLIQPSRSARWSSCARVATTSRR